MTRGASAFCVAAALLSGAFASDTPPSQIMSVNVCNIGVMQSPINLKTCPAKIEDDTFNIPEERPAIKLNYGASEMEIEKVCNSSKACMLNLHPKSPADSLATNMMEVAGADHPRRYKLDHCTVRMPAEHLINGRVAPLEVQCHHTLEHTGHRRKGILSTLYMASAASGFIGAFENNLPSTDGTEGKTTVKGVSWAPIGTAGVTRYHSYSGSQTTGDCSEDADWFVMYDPTGVSQAQLDKLAGNMTWMAARPAQDRYGREPEGCPVHHADAHGAAGLSALTLAATLFLAFA